MPRLLYRVVKTNPPTVEDFESHVALGKAPMSADPVKRRMAEGVSVYATLNQARRNARSFPGHGRYIAELIIPDGAALTIARTGRQPGHHTIWGDAAEILRYAASAVPV